MRCTDAADVGSALLLARAGGVAGLRVRRRARRDRFRRGRRRDVHRPARAGPGRRRPGGPDGERGRRRHLGGRGRGHPGVRPRGHRGPGLRPPASAASPSGRAAAGWSAPSGSPATTCSRPRSSPPTGAIVTASARENPDLFWAIRGGGGNFGVVTEFTFQLHPVGPIVLGGMLMYPASMARKLLRFWRDFMTDAPDAVGSRRRVHHRPAAGLRAGAGARPPRHRRDRLLRRRPRGRRTDLAPLLEFGPPAVNLVQPMPYVAVQQLLDQANPHGHAQLLERRTSSPSSPTRRSTR